MPLARIHPELPPAGRRRPGPRTHRSRRGRPRGADFESEPWAGTVCAAEEVILMRKFLFAAILAASSLLVMAAGVGASTIGPCCG